MTTQQPEALRLADVLDLLAMDMQTPRKAATELRRQHTEIGTLRHKLQTLEELGAAGDDVQLLRMGYAAARLEIASLSAQLEAVGAGGVESLRKPRPEALWYMLNKIGMATLCADKKDAEQNAHEAQASWPHMGPHYAAQMEPVGVGGVTALMAAPAQPVAWTVSGDVKDWSKDFSAYQTTHYTRPVFTQPPTQAQDAERMRWLCAAAFEIYGNYETQDGAICGFSWCSEIDESLDATIDAAIASQQRGA